VLAAGSRFMPFCRAKEQVSSLNYSWRGQSRGTETRTQLVTALGDGNRGTETRTQLDTALGAVSGAASGFLPVGISTTQPAPVCHFVRNLTHFAGAALRTNRVLQAQFVYGLRHPVVRAVGSSFGNAHPHSV
jgi:hypothetical protein